MKNFNVLTITLIILSTFMAQANDSAPYGLYRSRDAFNRMVKTMNEERLCIAEAQVDECTDKRISRCSLLEMSFDRSISFFHSCGVTITLQDVKGVQRTAVVNSWFKETVSCGLLPMLKRHMSKEGQALVQEDFQILKTSLEQLISARACR